MSTGKQLLNKASRRVTTQRALLLDLIRKSNGHLDADELYRKARDKHSTINLSTIYRNLQLFKQLGLIEERHFIEEHHHYEPKQTAEHQHFQCIRCGTIVEIDWLSVQQLKKDIEVQYGLQISDVEVSLTGLCQDCHSKETESAKRRIKS